MKKLVLIIALLTLFSLGTGLAAGLEAVPSATGSISVYVSDQNGNSVNSASVSISGPDYDSGYTSSSGYYSASNLETGTYSVSASKSGSSDSVTKSLDYNGDTESAYLTLNIGNGDDWDDSYNSAEGSISVQVSDQNGNSVSSASVSISGPDYDSGYTSSSGYYSASGLSTGYYTVSASKSGSSDSTSVSLDYNGDTETAYLTLYTGYDEIAKGSISVYVSDQNGNSVSSASVSISGPDYSSGYTDSSGYYSASDLATGSYSVSASTFCGSDSTTKSLDYNGDTETAYLTINCEEPQPPEPEPPCPTPPCPTPPEPEPINQNPHAHLTAPSGCKIPGSSVTLDASNSYDPDGYVSKYKYDFDGDGIWDSVTSSSRVSHTYEDSGDYTARVKVVDNEGAFDIDTDSACIQEEENKRPVADLSVPSECKEVGTNIELDASGSYDPDGEIKTYKWDFDGDGSWDETSTDDEKVRKYDEEGYYEAKVKVIDDDGASDIASGFVCINEEPEEENKPPVAVFEAISGCEECEECSGVCDYVHFNAMNSYDTDGDIVRYNWDFDGDGSWDRSTNSPVVSYRFASEGTYNTKLKVEDNEGSTDTTTKEICVEMRKGALSVAVENEEGDRIRSARVSVVRIQGGFSDTEYTGSTGRSIWEELNTGSYEINVRKSGYNERTVDAEVYEGQTTKKVVILGEQEDDRGDLKVKVKNKEGDRIEDARVSIELLDGEEYSDSSRTNKLGRVSFNNIPEGDYEIIGEKNGYEDKIEDTDVDKGGVTRETIILSKGEIYFEGDVHDIEILKVITPDKTHCGEKMILKVKVKNVGDYKEKNVKVRAKLFGETKISRGKTLYKGEVEYYKMPITVPVRASGPEKADFKAFNNNDKDYLNTEISVGGSEVSLYLYPQEARVGDHVHVDGYIQGEENSGKIYIGSKYLKKVRANEEGYYRTYITPKKPGSYIIKLKGDCYTESKVLKVVPEIHIEKLDFKDLVSTGEKFDVCADISSSKEGDMKVGLYVDNDKVKQKEVYIDGEKRVCFDTSIDTKGEKTITVLARIAGKEDRESGKIEVIKPETEFSVFPSSLELEYGDDGLVKVVLSNTDPKEKSYEVELNGIERGWVSSSTKRAKLSQGQSKTVYFDVNPSRKGEFSGDITVDVNGETRYQTPVDIFVTNRVPSCWDNLCLERLIDYAGGGINSLSESIKSNYIALGVIFTILIIILLLSVERTSTMEPRRI